MAGESGRSDKLRFNPWLTAKIRWTEAELLGADFNRDGEITPQDAVSIYEKSKEF